jgi:hypothetical protein
MTKDNNQGFRTLRGFLDNEEREEPNYFAYSATLRIFGDNLDFARIERELGHLPTLSYRKGYRKGPLSPAAKFDMWHYSAQLPEESPLHEHIDSLWANIHHAATFLCELKHRATVDVYLGYCSNIDHAGFQVPHTSLVMFQALQIPFGVSIVVL